MLRPSKLVGSGWFVITRAPDLIPVIPGSVPPTGWLYYRPRARINPRLPRAALLSPRARINPGGQRSADGLAYYRPRADLIPVTALVHVITRAPELTGGHRRLCHVGGGGLYVAQTRQIPPALALSAPTTTAQRVTETLNSFVALILSSFA